MIKRIKENHIVDKLFDKTWKKSLWVFVIVFSLVLIGGVASITYLSDEVSNQHIHSENIVVADKIHGDSSSDDYYLIVSKDNKTYTIENHKDGYGRKMFNNMEVGKKYRIVTKEPEFTDLNQFTHIMQVYNDTS